MGLIPGQEDSPGGGNGNPFQYSEKVSEKSHGQSSLTGYNPKGGKKSDPTE